MHRFGYAHENKQVYHVPLTNVAPPPSELELQQELQRCVACCGKWHSVVDSLTLFFVASFVTGTVALFFSTFVVWHFCTFDPFLSGTSKD
jgi:hypothetical protein